MSVPEETLAGLAPLKIVPRVPLPLHFVHSHLHYTRVTQYLHTFRECVIKRPTMKFYHDAKSKEFVLLRQKFLEQR